MYFLVLDILGNLGHFIMIDLFGKMYVKKGEKAYEEMGGCAFK